MKASTAETIVAPMMAQTKRERLPVNLDDENRRQVELLRQPDAEIRAQKANQQ